MTASFRYKKLGYVAINVTDVERTGDFLDGGTIVVTRGREPEDNHAYTASRAGDRIKDVPMVVLINGASASAAEIVPGALQDYHRAKLMGTRSFGKGSVQSIIPLGNGGALRLTTALYYTPKGRSIQGIGLQPDIPVAIPKTEEVANAVAFGESDYFGAIRNPGSMQNGGANPAKPVPSLLSRTDHTCEGSDEPPSLDFQIR